MISKDVNHLLTKNTSVVILDFSGGYLPGNLDNIVRLDASEPLNFWLHAYSESIEYITKKHI